MAKKRMILVVAAFLVAAAAGGGFFAYKNLASGSKPEEPEKAQDAHKGQDAHKTQKAQPPPKVSMGPVYAMDPFLVNLADPGRPRLLKVVLNLELDSGAVAAELDALKPKVRDTLLTLLSSKTMADLATVADKERLRNEIIHRVNTFIAAGKVVEVYFAEFVVQ
jgi:flagellar FliL protein